MIPVDARLAASENRSVNQVTASRATSRSAPRFLEQVARAGDHEQRLGRLHSRRRLFVQVQHVAIILADDEQRGGGDAREPAISKIGPAAARHHGGDQARRLGGGDQRRRRTRARAEVSERRGPGKRLPGRPPRRGAEAACEQGHVEARPGVGCLRFGEQIEQQRRDPRSLQRARDLHVTGARATRAAAMREDRRAARSIGDRQRGGEIDVVDVEDHLLGPDVSGLRLVGLLPEKIEGLPFEIVLHTQTSCDRHASASLAQAALARRANAHGFRRAVSRAQVLRPGLRRLTVRRATWRRGAGG